MFPFVWVYSRILVAMCVGMVVCADLWTCYVWSPGHDHHLCGDSCLVARDRPWQLTCSIKVMICMCEWVCTYMCVCVCGGGGGGGVIFVSPMLIYFWWASETIFESTNQWSLWEHNLWVRFIFCCKGNYMARRALIYTTLSYTTYARAWIISSMDYH